MSKKYLFIPLALLIFTCISGCSLDDIDNAIKKNVKDASKPKVTCSISTQSKDTYGFSYEIEGICTNNSSKDYDYLQIEFICYDKSGNNIGTAFDNTNNLLKGQKWKYNARALVDDTNSIDHCSFHEVTGW